LLLLLFTSQTLPQTPLRRSRCRSSSNGPSWAVPAAASPTSRPFSSLLLEPFANTPRARLRAGSPGAVGLRTTQTPTTSPGPTSTSRCSGIRPSSAPAPVLFRRRWGAAKGGCWRQCRAPWQGREDGGRAPAALSWQRLPCPCPVPQSRYCQAPQHPARSFPGTLAAGAASGAKDEVHPHPPSCRQPLQGARLMVDTFSADTPKLIFLHPRLGERHPHQ